MDVHPVLLTLGAALILGERFGPRRAAGVGAALVGAGSFARAVLLPAIRRFPGCRATGVMCASGLSAVSAGRQGGFAYATTSLEEILREPESADAESPPASRPGSVPPAAAGSNRISGVRTSRPARMRCWRSPPSAASASSRATRPRRGTDIS